MSGNSADIRNRVEFASQPNLIFRVRVVKLSFRELQQHFPRPARKTKRQSKKYLLKVNMLYIKSPRRIQILACVRNSVRFGHVRAVQKPRPPTKTPRTGTVTLKKRIPHNAPHAQLFYQLNLKPHSCKPIDEDSLVVYRLRTGITQNSVSTNTVRWNASATTSQEDKTNTLKGIVKIKEIDDYEREPSPYWPLARSASGLDDSMKTNYHNSDNALKKFPVLRPRRSKCSYNLFNYKTFEVLVH